MATLRIPVEFLAEISPMLLSYNQVCDAFGLTEEERRNPNAGVWILDRYKQLQTAALMTEAVKSRRQGNTVEGYSTSASSVNPLTIKPLDAPLATE